MELRHWLLPSIGCKTDSRSMLRLHPGQCCYLWLAWTRDEEVTGKNCGSVIITVLVRTSFHTVIIAVGNCTAVYHKTICTVSSLPGHTKYIRGTTSCVICVTCVICTYFQNSIPSSWGQTLRIVLMEIVKDRRTDLMSVRQVSLLT